MWGLGVGVEVVDRLGESEGDDEQADDETQDEKHD